MSTEQTGSMAGPDREPSDRPPADPAATDPTIEALPFDEAMAEFQRVVGELETGGQPLEEALALYERGVALQAHLERLLADAELRIRRLVERSGGQLDAVDHRDVEG